MQFESFNKRLLNKIDKALTVYERYIFEPADEITEVLGFETKEHLRIPPKSGYHKVVSGDTWGCEFGNIWIRADYTVPESLAGKKLYLMENTGAREVLVFINGVPVDLFSRAINVFEGRQDQALLTEKAEAGQQFHIDLDCYAWHYVPGGSAYENLGKDTAEDAEFVKTFENLRICVCNDIVLRAIVDLKIALQAARCEAYPFLKAKAGDLLEKAFAELILFPDAYEKEEINESLTKVLEILEPLFEGHFGKTNGYIGMIGHSHMDTAWLWPVNETIRKCARTYAKATSLMKRYPNYKFVQSSALHTYWMEKYYPDIFEQIKERTKEGRYEPNGGAWVECDCNITGGEYMIRQFLKGQNYLQEKLDYRSDSFWLPDTFGYSAAIPQIMLGCGIKYFYTTKIDWNEHNHFPYESFIWKGIDGSEVITHLNKMYHEVSVDSAARFTGELQNKQADDGRLIAFGFGDGGGGPTEVTVMTEEQIQKVDGIPKVEYTTVSEFGKRLEAAKERLPVYHGELYLELHRGTLTQMHDVKRNNRKAEIALHDMELVNVLTDADYDKEDYDQKVKTLLLNQFHDILPGSSIKCVNDQSIKETTALIHDVHKEISRCGETAVSGEGITLVNPLSFERSDAFHLNSTEKGIKGAKNQLVEDVSGRKLLAVSGITLRGFEAKSFETEVVKEEVSPFIYDGNMLETPYARITFEENGYISSYVDKMSGRELRREGAASLGTFYLGEDISELHDNWDIEYDQKFRMKVVKGFKGRTLVSEGPVEIRLRSVFELSAHSQLIQDFIAYADSPRIDFQTKMIWNEKHKLLKVSFDVDVFANMAKHEVQFGHIERPTTENNSLEAAKFEVCNHKWTDLSESRFGVAMLNDSKYGISVRESDMRLSLHRAGCRPDYTGDAGVHETTYSILPHGAFSTEQVIKPAYELNYEPIELKGSLCEALPVPVAIEADNVICEAVKPVENGEHAYVVRLYEVEKNKTTTTLTFPKEAKKVYLTNMLEEVIEELPVENGKVTLTFRPFEIKTIMVVR